MRQDQVLQGDHMMSTLQACALLTAYSLIKHFERCAHLELRQQPGGACR